MILQTIQIDEPNNFPRLSKTVNKHGENSYKLINSVEASVKDKSIRKVRIRKGLELKG